MTRRRSLTDAQVKQAKELHKSGLGYGKISKELGIPESTVRDAVLSYTAYSMRILCRQ